MNITEPLRVLARRAPDRIAIAGGPAGALTYRALDQAIDRMAGYAEATGLRAGDVAGLAIGGPDETLSLILAFALARLGVATAEPFAPAEQLRLCFQQGAQAAPGCVAYNAAWIAATATVPMVRIRDDASALCRVFASSGTTGTPKHMPLTHGQLTTRLFGRWLGFSSGRATRIVALSLGGSFGFESVLRTLWAGGTLVLSNPAQAATAIARYGVTSIVISPAALRTMIEQMPADQGKLPSLACLEVGGSALPESLYRLAVERVCPHVLTTYGSTETSATACAPHDMLLQRPGAVGFVVPGVCVQAVDSNDQPLADGTDGILRIRSPFIGPGYLWGDGAPATGFRDGWFYTGDIGHVAPDGMIVLAGRVSELINSGGVKVSPQQIESALLSLPTVLDAAAFAMQDETGMEQIWAAIVARARIDDAVLNAFCERALRGIAPKVILQMKALPRNENGKVMRDRLVEIAHAAKASRA